MVRLACLLIGSSIIAFIGIHETGENKCLQEIVVVSTGGEREDNLTFLDIASIVLSIDCDVIFLPGESIKGNLGSKIGTGVVVI